MGSTRKISAPDRAPIPGLYWETGWFPSYYDRVIADGRPCESGLNRYFTIPHGVRFKVCFAARTEPLLPEAYGSYAHPRYVPENALEPLRVRQCRYFWVLVREGGFENDSLLQWWVEIEEIENAE